MQVTYSIGAECQFGMAKGNLKEQLGDIVRQLEIDGTVPRQFQVRTYTSKPNYFYVILNDDYQLVYEQRSNSIYIIVLWFQLEKVFCSK